MEQHQKSSTKAQIYTVFKNSVFLVFRFQTFCFIIFNIAILAFLSFHLSNYAFNKTEFSIIQQSNKSFLINSSFLIAHFKIEMKVIKEAKEKRKGRLAFKLIFIYEFKYIYNGLNFRFKFRERDKEKYNEVRD